MILRSDGYLDENLAPYPGGLEERLAKKFGRNRWNGVHGLWLREEDKTTEEKEQRRMNEYALLPPLVSLPSPRFVPKPTRKLCRKGIEE
jgi:hypothetical protein